MRTRKSQKKPLASSRRKVVLRLHRKRRKSLGFAAKGALKELWSLPKEHGVYVLDLNRARWFETVARHLCEGVARVHEPASVAAGSVRAILDDYRTIYKGARRDYPYKILDVVSKMLWHGRATLKELNCVRALLRRIFKEFPYHRCHQFTT